MSWFFSNLLTNSWTSKKFNLLLRSKSLIFRFASSMICPQYTNAWNKRTCLDLLHRTQNIYPLWVRAVIKPSLPDALTSAFLKSTSSICLLLTLLTIVSQIDLQALLHFLQISQLMGLLKMKCSTEHLQLNSPMSKLLPSRMISTSRHSIFNASSVLFKLLLSKEIQLLWDMTHSQLWERKNKTRSHWLLFTQLMKMEKSKKLTHSKWERALASISHWNLLIPKSEKPLKTKTLKI